MYSKPTAPQTIGQVLDSTFKLWLPVLRKSWVLILFPQLLSTAIAIAQILLNPTADPTSLLLDATAHPASLMLIFISIVIAVIWIGLYNAMWLLADSAASGNRITLGESVSTGFRRWFPFVGLCLLFALMVAPIFIAAFWQVGFRPGIGVAQAPLGRSASPTTLLEETLFMLAYVVLMIWAFGRLFLSMQLVVLERLGPVQALRRSWALTRGNWGRCAAILMIVTIVFYLFLLVLGAVTAFVGVQNLEAGRQALPIGFRIAQQVISSVYGVAVTPLFLAANLSIYFDLKLRKEGADLAGKIAALGAAAK